MTQFVRNRVDKVLKISGGKSPLYINTDKNPADVASGGVRLKQQKDCDLWTYGPKFLLQPIESWENGVSQQPNTDEMEVKAEVVATGLRLNTLHLQRDNHVIKALADSSSCTEAEKRLKTVQNCFQALRNKSKAFLDTSKAELSLPVSAKLLLLKMAQYKCMGDIITTMRKETLSFKQAILKLHRQKRPHYFLELCKFVPFLSDEGLLRIGEGCRTQNWLCILNTPFYFRTGIGQLSCT